MKRKAIERIKKGLQRNSTIQITVDSNCKFYYTDEEGLPAYYKSVKKPRPNEKVFLIWWADDNKAEFTITFANGSPFTRSQFNSNGGFVKALVRQSPDPIPYKYSVVYAAGEEVCEDDPQIIIN